jgi:hypothetical protein
VSLFTVPIAFRAIKKEDLQAALLARYDLIGPCGTSH